MMTLPYSAQQQRPHTAHENPSQCTRSDGREDWSTLHILAFSSNTYDTPMTLLHCPTRKSNSGILGSMKLGRLTEVYEAMLFVAFSQDLQQQVL